MFYVCMTDINRKRESERKRKLKRARLTAKQGTEREKIANHFAHTHTHTHWTLIQLRVEDDQLH